MINASSIVIVINNTSLSSNGIIVASLNISIDTNMIAIDTTSIGVSVASIIGVDITIINNTIVVMFMIETLMVVDCLLRNKNEASYVLSAVHHENDTQRKSVTSGEWLKMEVISLFIFWRSPVLLLQHGFH